MERLTEKTKDCFGYRLKDGSDAEVGFFKDYDAFFSHNMVVKALGEYEDLEEQGLLLRLPCKVGDTVYIITQVFNGKEVIGAIGRRKIDSIGGNALNPIYVISKEPYELRFCPSEFGVRVFKTKEEAEAKLKELEGSEEE